MQNAKTRNLVLCAIFSAIVVVMTVVPYTGYINYGVFLEITTLHIVVIVGAVAMGWRYGAVLGGVWGVTCMARAFTNPLWAPFQNPLISLLPRIVVGIVAGAVYAALSKRLAGRTMRPAYGAIVGVLSGALTFLGLQSMAGWGNVVIKAVIAVAIAAAVSVLFVRLAKKHQDGRVYAAAVAGLCASLTNTVLVLTTFNLFGGMITSYAAVFELFKGILSTVVGINGVIELLGAVVVVPVLVVAIFRQQRSAQ